MVNRPRDRRRACASPASHTSCSARRSRKRPSSSTRRSAACSLPGLPDTSAALSRRPHRRRRRPAALLDLRATPARLRPDAQLSARSARDGTMSRIAADARRAQGSRPERPPSRDRQLAGAAGCPSDRGLRLLAGDPARPVRPPGHPGRALFVARCAAMAIGTGDRNYFMVGVVAGPSGLLARPCRRPGRPLARNGQPGRRLSRLLDAPCRQPGAGLRPGLWPGSPLRRDRGGRSPASRSRRAGPAEPAQ